MSKYVSRRYLREKWEDLKWDMENIIRVYSDDGDDVSEEAERVKANILDKLESIRREVE